MPPEKLQRLIDDSTTALRAPKDIGDKAHPDAEGVDDARTAVRYVGTDRGVEKFQVITTKLTAFPIGSTTVSIQTRDTVEHWIEANDVDEIHVENDDGFEPTERDEDPLREAAA